MTQQECITEIVSQALIKAIAYPESLLFDPQGRVLVTLRFDAQEKAKLEQGLGRKMTPEMIVSLDRSQNPELTEIYAAQYGLKEENLSTLNEFKGSIIPLFHEYHFNLALAARTYTQLDKDNFPKEAMDVAHRKAMVRVHQLVVAQFKQASALLPDEAGFLAALDKGRAAIFQQAHNIFAEEAARATGGKKLSRELLGSKKAKHIAETTTASANDLIHVNGDLNQYTWIEGTDASAHDRQRGKLVTRQVITVPMEMDSENATEKRQLQIRTPSLDVKKRLSSDDIRFDISGKLEQIKKNYEIETVVTQGPLVIHETDQAKKVTQKPFKAFTYNLLTAINDSPDDLRVSNKQSQGARNILAGADYYNSQEIKKEHPVLCFVQNISVNGFGDSLGYDGNELRQEATLMAELAMLYNLASDDDKELIQPAFDRYMDFLKDPKRGEFFSQSKQGQKARDQIELVQAKWQQQQGLPNDGDPVKNALRVMMANNLHHRHEYAKLFQALSIYTEEASIYGCKSGNERAQAIAGRVAVLKSECRKPDSAVFRAIQELAEHPEKAEESAEKLKTAVDKKYNKHLHAALAFISILDQGASAKVEAMIKSILPSVLLSRNYAEESSLTDLKQSKAGKMQAHKDLTKAMASAAGGEILSYAEYVGANKNPLLARLAMLNPLNVRAYNEYQKSMNEANARIDHAVALPEKEPPVVQKPQTKQEAQNSQASSASKPAQSTWVRSARYVDEAHSKRPPFDESPAPEAESLKKTLGEARARSEIKKMSQNEAESELNEKKQPPSEFSQM